MNSAHWHLLLNHAPLWAALFGAALLAWASLRKSEEVARIALVILVVGALLTIPTYLTGEPAEEIVEHLPGVLHDPIEAHESAGKIALISMLVVGATALGGLAAFRRRALPSWFTSVALVLSLAAVGVMGWTANLGGKVRHSEIRDGAAAATNAEQGGEMGERGEREAGEH